MAIKSAEVLQEKVLNEVSKTVVGKADIVKFLLIALITGGHVLLEGVPGVAKTLIAKTFAKSLGLSFRRIQFTPDMLPSDITGTFVYNPRTQDFNFREGPVFANVILADEINRATPKTQSALLEAMQESQVTVEGFTKPLSDTFMVLATQNPVELHGTYPLPEAQIDRFMFRLIIELPEQDEEVAMLKRGDVTSILEKVQAVISPLEIAAIRQEVTKMVHVEEDLLRYIVSIVSSTRNDRIRVLLGGSPRSSVQLLAASRCLAAFNGRTYVTPDDVKEMAFPVLNHRLILNPEYAVKSGAVTTLFNYDKARAVILGALSSVEPPR